MAPDTDPPVTDLRPTHDAPIETDAVIVGAGPVGLFQVFELGLLDIRAHVIDVLPYPGGQCIELYPDKPIYDIPALPVCTGRELIDRLLQQIKPFAAHFHLGQEVSVLQRQPDQRFYLETTQGTRFLTRTVFIAGGVGSFQPRSLKVEGLDKFEGRQLLYRVGDPAALAAQQVVIVGGGEAALEWALKLSQDGPHQAQSVTLIHRRDHFQANPALVDAVQARRASGQVQFMAGQVTGGVESDGRLTHLQVTGSDGVTRPVPLDTGLVFFGLSPKLGPIGEWGLDIDRKQVVVDTEKFESSEPGIFAVGDINTYPGKKKLILSGFHEATLAAFGATSYVFPDQRVLLQYTTTSPKLHKLLGVTPPAPTEAGKSRSQ